MATIKKSVKQIVIEILKQNGELDLKEITSKVNGSRENIHPAHVRGVLNRDIKQGGKFFQRTARGKYRLMSVTTTPILKETVTPTVPDVSSDDLSSNEGSDQVAAQA